MELAKWLKRTVGDTTADQVVAFSNECVVVPLDAAIYATALRHGTDLVTCDAHLDGMPGVIHVPKTAR